MPGVRDPTAPTAHWKRFRLGTKLNIGLGNAAMDSYVHRETLKLEDMKRQGKVVMEVADEAVRGTSSRVATSSATSVSYLEQGDVTMYTAENLKKRKNLQHDPRLLEQVEQWWETCIITATRATGNARTEMDELPKAEFYALECRLQKALMLTYDEAEALASAEDDWNTDVGPDQTTMTRAAFVSSLLELADVWTHTAEADEYVEFLHHLFEVIAEQEKEQTSTRRHLNQNSTSTPSRGGGGGGGDGDGGWQPAASVVAGGDRSGRGDGDGDGDGDRNGNSPAATTVAAALGRRFCWRPVHDIVSFCPSLHQWTQPEDEEEVANPGPTSLDDQAGLPPHAMTTAELLSQLDVAAASQATPASVTRGSKKLGDGNATTGAAAQALVPQRKGMNLMQQKQAPAQKGVTPAGTRSAVPERELKALSSRPIGEVVEEMADLTGCRIPLRSPLKAALNAQRAVMALQKWSAERAAAPEGAAAAAAVPAAVLAAAAVLAVPGAAALAAATLAAAPDEAAAPADSAPDEVATSATLAPAALAATAAGKPAEADADREAAQRLRGRCSSTNVQPVVSQPAVSLEGGVRSSSLPVIKSGASCDDVQKNSRLLHGGGYAGGGKGCKSNTLSQASHVSRQTAASPSNAPVHVGGACKGLPRSTSSASQSRIVYSPHRMVQAESGGTQPSRAQIPRNGGGGGVARMPAEMGGGGALAGADVIVPPPPSELKGSLRAHGGKTTAVARRQPTPSLAEHYEPSIPSPNRRSGGGGLALVASVEPPIAVARKLKEAQAERRAEYSRPKLTLNDGLLAKLQFGSV